MYVPGAVMVASALLPSPLSQANDPVPTAVTLIEVVVQVRTFDPLLLVIETVGKEP